MPLKVDLGALEAAIRLMGTDPVPFKTGVVLDPLDPIDHQLQEGIELTDLRLVSSNDGLLSYEGRQILLYIQDHGGNIDAALSDPSTSGKKFHVADCRTLQQMRDHGRFDRYRITNKLDGSFFITGKSWGTGRQREGHAQLNVCQNCLKHLNYKGATHGHVRHLVQGFRIGEFFSTYASFFKYLPKLEAGRAEDDSYTNDWKLVSARYKADSDFTCEDCGVHLSAHKALLHVHHKNGVKGDNRHGNLEVLCASCHRFKPAHGHMFVSHSHTQLINRLRREQKVLPDKGWNEAIEYADPGLHGVLDICRKHGTSVPQVGLDLLDPSGGVCATLELAWARPMVGVAIGEDDVRGAREIGWRVWKMMEVLTAQDEFLEAMRQSR